MIIYTTGMYCCSMWNPKNHVGTYKQPRRSRRPYDRKSCMYMQNWPRNLKSVTLRPQESKALPKVIILHSTCLYNNFFLTQQGILKKVSPAVWSSQWTAHVSFYYRHFTSHPISTFLRRQKQSNHLMLHSPACTCITVTMQPPHRSQQPL